MIEISGYGLRVDPEDRSDLFQLRQLVAASEAGKGEFPDLFVFSLRNSVRELENGPFFAMSATRLRRVDLESAEAQVSEVVDLNREILEAVRTTPEVDRQLAEFKSLFPHARRGTFRVRTAL